MLIYNYGLTYGSTFFLLILLSMYFTQKRVNSLRTRLFIYFLIMALIFCLTEIIIAPIHTYIDNFYIQKYSVIFHWVICIYTFYSFYLYEMLLIKNTQYNSAFELIIKNKEIVVVTILAVIETTVYAFFTKYTPFDLNNVDILASKFAAVTQSSLTVLFGILYVYNAVKYRKNLSTLEKKGVAFCVIVFVIGLTIQTLVLSISFIPTAVVVIAFYLYFNSENPNLLLIDDASKREKESNNMAEASDYLVKSVIDQTKEPLNILTESIKDILSQQNLKDYKDNFSKIASPTFKLLNILDTKINISNSMTSEIESQTDYNVKNLLDGFAKKYINNTAGLNVKFQIKAGNNIPSVLKGNIESISVIIANLINNSITYTEAGKIILQVESFNLDNKNIELQISILDTGKGMSHEEIDNLLNSDISNGIVITKKLIERIGGRFEISSTKHVGSEFKIVIKQEVVDDTPLGEYIIPDNNKELINYTNYNLANILICDDNKLCIKLLKENLKNYNFNIEEANHGELAINMIKSNDNYKIIFVDDLMAEMTGTEMLSIIKEINKDIKVVIYTANAILGQKEKYLNLGFDGFVSKPIDIFELDTTIKNCMKEEEKTTTK